MSILDQNLLTLENSASALDATGSAVGSALVEDVLRGSRVEGVGSSVRLRVYGESMLPTLWPGDVVEIKSCSLADVRPGEIVLARHEGRLFLHRLVAATADGFVLRGDSMPGPDPRFPSDALLGRLSCVVDGRRRVSTSRWPRSMMTRALGIVFCHCGPARRLALRIHPLWKRSLKNCPPPRSLTAAAKAVSESRPDLAAVNRSTPARQSRAFWGPRRCATQTQEHSIEVGRL